jgi:hypothetical protein
MGIRGRRGSHRCASVAVGRAFQLRGGSPGSTDIARRRTACAHACSHGRPDLPARGAGGGRAGSRAAAIVARFRDLHTASRGAPRPWRCGTSRRRAAGDECPGRGRRCSWPNRRRKGRHEAPRQHHARCGSAPRGTAPSGRPELPTREHRAGAGARGQCIQHLSCFGTGRGRPGEDRRSGRHGRPGCVACDRPAASFNRARARCRDGAHSARIDCPSNLSARRLRMGPPPALIRARSPCRCTPAFRGRRPGTDAIGARAGHAH